jgi:hypothetical protein
MSSCVDRYIVCENWFIGCKDFLGTFHKNIPGRSSSVIFGTVLIIPRFSPCRPESIGMLIVKIGRTVKTLFNGVFWHESYPLAPLEWNFENFDDFVLFPLLIVMYRSVYYLWKSVDHRCIASENWLNGWIVIQQADLVWNPNWWSFSPKSNPENKILVFPLKFLSFFRQAAPIELIWAKIAWTVAKLFKVLFMPEIPIPGPILGILG